MKTYSTTKKFPIIAGMKFNYDGTTKMNMLQEVGYKVIKFIYDSKEKDCLINEIEIKRVFYI